MENELLQEIKVWFYEKISPDTYNEAMPVLEELFEDRRTRPQPPLKPDAAEALGRFDKMIRDGDHDANGVNIGNINPAYLRRCDIQTIRAALQNAAPKPEAAEVFDGLRNLDYQRDLAIVFMVAKQSKDYDETIADRLERVQELILQLKKRNDYLEATLQNAGVQWMPIETAPRDGTPFIGYSPVMGVVRNVRWSDRRQDFDLNGWSCFVRDYTHWHPDIPLPAAPPPRARRLRHERS